MRLKLFSIIISAILLIGCAGNQPNQNGSYIKGKKAFQNENWRQAKDQLKLFLLNNPGSKKSDSAQFLLAESYFNNEKYLLAISEYKQLKNRYSYSSLVEKAEYKIAQSYVKLSPIYQRDQKYTRKALQHLQSFIDKYPDSKYVDETEEKIKKMRTKLAKKLYSSAVQYKKMGRWQAASIYFEKTINNYYDTPVAKKAQVGKALCLIKLRQFEKYKKVLEKIKSQYESDDSNYLKKKLAYLDSTYKEEKEEMKEEKEERKGRF